MCAAIDAVPPRAPLRLAALLMPLAASDATRALEALRFSGAMTDAVCARIAVFASALDAPLALERALGRHGEDAVLDALALRAAHGEDVSALRAREIGRAHV
jgi:hypothetical protein